MRSDISLNINTVFLWAGLRPDSMKTTYIQYRVYTVGGVFAHKEDA